MGIVRNLAEDARTTSRWYLIVSMGRAARFLALGIGKATAATLTIIPEEFRRREVTLEELCDILLGAILKRRSQSSPFGVAVLAEGLLAALGEKVLKAIGLAKLRHHGKVEQDENGDLKLERDDHGHLRLGEFAFGRMIKDRLAGWGCVSFGAGRFRRPVRYQQRG